MLVDHYPLFGLCLRTPRLELRLPTPEELGQLADLAAEGIHDPEMMPFVVPWSDQPPAGRARSVVQYFWRRQGELTPEHWALLLMVFCDGVVVGQQELGATDFATTREVMTGSWVGRAHQGRGIGTEMRAAVLHLAFVGLGATDAVSAAFDYNHPSLAVSRKLGYSPDGVERQVVRGKVATLRRQRMTRQDWDRHQTVPVTVRGLEPCLELLGAGPADPR